MNAWAVPSTLQPGDLAGIAAILDRVSAENRLLETRSFVEDRERRERRRRGEVRSKAQAFAAELEAKAEGDTPAQAFEASGVLFDSPVTARLHFERVIGTDPLDADEVTRRVNASLSERGKARQQARFNGLMGR